MLELEFVPAFFETLIKKIFQTRSANPAYFMVSCLNLDTCFLSHSDAGRPTFFTLAAPPDLQQCHGEKQQMSQILNN